MRDGKDCNRQKIEEPKKYKIVWKCGRKVESGTYLENEVSIVVRSIMLMDNCSSIEINVCK